MRRRHGHEAGDRGTRRGSWPNRTHQVLQVGIGTRIPRLSKPIVQSAQYDGQETGEQNVGDHLGGNVRLEVVRLRLTADYS